MSLSNVVLRLAGEVGTPDKLDARQKPGCAGGIDAVL